MGWVTKRDRGRFPDVNHKQPPEPLKSPKKALRREGCSRGPNDLTKSSGRYRAAGNGRGTEGLATSSGRNFGATKRRSRVSSALYTTPRPPPPNFSTMR